MFDEKRAMLTQDLFNRLKNSQYWTERTRDNDHHIQGLICPECGKAEAWAYSKEPWVIICNRQSKCGARTKVLELFPELIRNIEEEFKATSNDPNKPATAYLQSRGFNGALNGLKYEYWKNVRKTNSGAVMFLVGTNAKSEQVYNGRLFNPPPGEGKTHNQGKTSGMFWKHSTFEYNSEQETFVTEGILDALSLIEMGLQAIAVLSAGQDPANVNLSEFKNLTLAFDNDQAGKKALRKWKEHYPDAQAVMPVRGDWNDFLLYHAKDEIRNLFEKNRKEFEFRTNLALASNAQAYAEVYHNHKGYTPGLFAFDGCFYYASVKIKKVQGEEIEEVITSRISNFTLSVDHYQLDTTNPEEPVNRYFLKIKPKKGRPVSCVVLANELASSNGLTTMFLQRARVLWEGDKKPSLALARRIVEAKAPVVRQLHTIGYDPESRCYVFKDFMVNRQGQIVKPNQHGFFELAKTTYIRAAQYPTIKPVKGIPPKEIYNLICEAWPEQGPITFAWLLASWFVNQIKTEIGFFPFLSFYGDTQTGKTVLTRIMNACQCLDEEGLPMQKVNTSKGEIRKLAQRSGLFKALLESNKKDNTRFDIDSILTLYNSNPLQVRALKTNDIQTQEVAFLSSLLFVQNREPFKTKAQKERVVSVEFDGENLTEKTTGAFKKLANVPISQFAYFFPYVMQHRQKIEAEWVDAFQNAKKDLSAIQDARIIENHALVLTFHRFLSNLLNINQDLQTYIKEMAEKKHKQCTHRDETTADIFFSIIENFTYSEKDWFLDRNETDKKLYVNLGEALKRIKDEGYQFNIQIKDLQDSLKNHPACITNERHWFEIGHSTVQKRAWVFDATKLHED